MKMSMAIVWCVALGFGSLFAQTDGTHDVQESLKVQLVELDVKVTDWAGNFISGLDQSQFSVFEDGSSQAIHSFEEVNLTELSEEDRQAYQSRIMVVLDLKNTSFSRMKRTIPLLKEYAETLFSQSAEMGLAFNGDGYIELLPFTSDKATFLAAVDEAADLYARSKYRLLKPSVYRQVDVAESNHASLASSEIQALFAENNSNPSMFNSETLSLRDSSATRRISSAATDRYVGSEIQALQQFVNYLSAYSGKKSVVLVSQMWNKPVENEDLRDIVTTCLQHKISLNVLGLEKGPDITEERNVHTGDRGQFSSVGDRSGLAINTAGFAVVANYRNMVDMFDRVVKLSERYYRIRYYSQRGEDGFRDIKVKAGGIKYLVSTFSGFQSGDRKVDPGENGAQIARSAVENADLNLSMDTDWLYWEYTGLRKRRALYAISHRAYGEDGRIVGEKVMAGQLIQRKYDGEFEKVRLEKDYALNLPKGVPVARLSFVVVDLQTGRQIEIDLS